MNNQKILEIKQLKKSFAGLDQPVLDNINKEKYTFYQLDLNKDSNEILELIDTFVNLVIKTDATSTA